MIDLLRFFRTPPVAAFSVLFVLAASRFAHADCAADFAADNAIKPEAGAFRVVSVVQTTTEMGGKTYPMAGGRTVVEWAPPSSLRLRNEMPFDKSEVVIADGKKGWARGEEGPWKPLAAGKVRDIVSGPGAQRYLTAENQQNLACLGESRVEGRNVRSYRYTTGEAALPVQVTAHFDAKTGLPHSGATDNRIGKTQSHTVMTFEFDRSIAIAPPR